MPWSLKCLKLYGLRSFDNNLDRRYHEINFDSNITIIKGRNGSGKTTVIEALVFALTGKHSTSPEGLSSFLIGTRERGSSEIIVELVKDGNTWGIHWVVQRPTKKGCATCNITCNGTTTLSNLSIEKGQEEIRNLLGVPSGTIEMLLMVPHENALWAFDKTPKGLKDMIDMFLGLEEDNASLERLVSDRKELQEELNKHLPTLKPIQEKADLYHKLLLQLNEAKCKERKFKEEEAVLEREKDAINSELGSQLGLQVMERNVTSLARVIEALQIPEGLINGETTRQKLDLDLARLQTEMNKKHVELDETKLLKCELDKELTNSHDKLTRATVKSETANEAQSQLQLSLSQSNSQDANCYKVETADVIAQTEEWKETSQKKLNKLQQRLIDTENLKTEVVTKMETNEIDIAKEEKNLLNLQGFLKENKATDSKLTAVKRFEEYLNSFSQRIEAHTIGKQKLQLGQSIEEEYKLVLSSALELEKKVSNTEGRLVCLNEFLAQISLINNDCNQALLEKGKLQTVELQSTLVATKTELEQKNAYFQNLQKLLFEELRLDLPCAILSRFNEVHVIQSAVIQENGSPAKVSRLDVSCGEESKSISLLGKQIQDKMVILEDLRKSKPLFETKKIKLGVEIQEIKALIQTKQDDTNASETKMLNLRKSLEQFDNLQSQADLSDEAQNMVTDRKNSFDDVKRQITETEMTINEINLSLRNDGIKRQTIESQMTALDHINGCKEAIKKRDDAKICLLQKGLATFDDVPSLDLHIENLRTDLARKETSSKITNGELSAAISAKKQVQNVLQKIRNAPEILKLAQVKKGKLENDIKSKKTHAKDRREEIMNKHQRMNHEINEYLRNHWSILYPHDDIPTITLYSEVKSVGEKRVDYNYHFNMHTTGENNELRMRGRASHGEKVLASLIIRCALMEKFVPGCPIVAFDEPQANLDAEVVSQLADHFSTITGGTQVILTTYSDQFWTQLQPKLGGQFTLYKLQKDNGKSTIIA